MGELFTWFFSLLYLFSHSPSLPPPFHPSLLPSTPPSSLSPSLPFLPPSLPPSSLPPSSLSSPPSSLLQIDGEVIAGYSSDKASKVFKKASAQRITLAVRDRPFERTITMQKDSSNHVGFSYNNGEIKAIVKDSSAAR